MSIKPQYNTESYFRREGAVNAQSIVECRFARSDDLADVIAVNVQINPSDCTASSGRINYGGRLICTVVYADESGKLCRVQKGAEFAHFVDGDNFTAAQSCLCKLTCLKNQVKREGSSLIVSVVVNAEIVTFIKAERTYLASCDGAVCQSKKITLADYSLFSGGCEVEDEFEVEGVADVLVPAATPLVYACECKTNVIVVSGEVTLSLLAVRASAPVSLERIIPFKAEISCDEATFGNVCDCSVNISDLNVVAKVDDERGKCRIECALSLAFEGSFCDEREESAVCDLFSVTNEIIEERGDQTINRCTGIDSYSRRVSAAAVSRAKLNFACAFKAVALPVCEYTHSGDTIEGAVTATLIYEQSGEIMATEITIPFSIKAVGGDCDIAVCGVSVRQRAEGECEGEAVLKIACRKREKAITSFITSVTEGGEVVPNDSAVTVYLPTADDDMWSLCKKLKKSEKELLSCNPDLKLPFNGSERVIIYRRKQA